MYDMPTLCHLVARVAIDEAGTVCIVVIRQEGWLGKRPGCGGLGKKPKKKKTNLHSFVEIAVARSFCKSSFGWTAV